jgi:hypothetical protein
MIRIEIPPDPPFPKGGDALLSKLKRHRSSTGLDNLIALDSTATRFQLTSRHELSH